jgi:hypothetical protein
MYDDRRSPPVVVSNTAVFHCFDGNMDGAVARWLQEKHLCPVQFGAIIPLGMSAALTLPAPFLHIPLDQPVRNKTLFFEPL